MRKTIIAIMSLVAMVACTNDITVMEQAPSAISFENSFVENKTRAAVDPSITTATIDAFDVWGFMDDPNGLMFDAQRVTKGEAGWTYSPLQFWAEDHNYYFYAVAPVDNANIVVNKDLNIQGLGTIDFTNTDGAVDLLYAEKQESTYDENVATNGHESVKFTFAHLLSKIKFTFTNGFPEGTSSLKIEDLKISQAPSKGTVTLNDDNAGRTWAITENNATLNFGHVNGGAALVPNQSEESDVERLTIPADANVRYQIDFKVTLYTGSNVAMVSNKTVYLENQAFVIGKNYNITATIDQTNIAEEALKPIEFDVVEVENWIPGDYNGNLDYDENGNPIDPAKPEVLATPVVDASVEGNVVTLTWDAVENAAQYSITVGTEMPVFVEETTYVFTGEYDTEYTFNVVAVPEDEEKFAASEAATAKATTEAESQPETPVAGSQVSVAKFLEMADTATEYVLTGKVARVVNTQYGNFDLTDETGTIYIYGLVSPTGAAQYWAESGVREGDTITVKGKYSVYNNSPQVKNAVYVSHVPAPFVFAEAAAIEADVVEVSISVESNVAWTVSCDATWVKSYSKSGTDNSDIDIEVEANTTTENRVATFTISGEGVADYTVTLTQYGAGASDTKGTYTSEAFFKGGTDGGKSYLEKVNVGGTQYDCLKLGTSSVIGKYTTKAVGESGDLTLSFYAVGWNGKTSKLNVYVDGVKVGETLTLKANSGAANNAPYTITPSDTTDYYSISVPGITEASQITFETVSGATRAIIFGVQLY